MVLGALVVCAALVTGCLEDLPEPLTCPPDALIPGESCLPGLFGVAPGCLLPEQTACLTGPRQSCTCIADECPPPEQACYPEGDCPVEVTGAAGDDVRCLRLSPKEIGAGLPSESQCLCGCGGCMAVCDGRGPVLGVASDGSLQIAPILFDVADEMPDRGSIGVFLRGRGLSGAALAVLKGQSPDFELLAVYYIALPIGTEYTSQIFYDDPFLGTKEYRWDSPEGKPTLIAVVGGDGTPEALQVTLMEIDCVIPFVSTD